MALFTPNRTRFLVAPKDDETEDGLPMPIRVKVQARRAAAIAEAKEIVRHLPAEAEAVHVLFSRRLELSDVLAAILDTGGKADRMTIASLGFSKKSLNAMCNWLDTGKVQRLTLLASEFFRAHNRSGLWQETLDAFKERGQIAVCTPSHAKVTVVRFASGVSLCTEGSSNLCSSGSGIEQIAIVRDNGLCDWHERWIGEKTRNA
jgi:hypothetical protein